MTQEERTNLRVRHEDDAAVALASTDVRETDAGVTGCPLHDSTSRFQPGSCKTLEGTLWKSYAQAELLSILDYAQRRAILHTPSRVLELGLAVDVRAGLLRQSLEIDLPWL